MSFAARKGTRCRSANRCLFSARRSDDGVARRRQSAAALRSRRNRPGDRHPRCLCPHSIEGCVAGLDHAGRSRRRDCESCVCPSRSPLRYPLCGEGQYRCRRSADDLRLPRVQLCGGALRDRRGGTGGSGGSPHRQDKSRPVRDGLERDTLALRYSDERIQSGLYRRRLKFRLGGSGCRRTGVLRARHGHGRFRPRAGSVQ